MPVLGGFGIGPRGFGVFGTKGPQGAPYSVVATGASVSQIDLSWLNADPTANIEIFRDGSSIVVKGPGNTSYSDTGRTEGTSYTYLLRHEKNGLYTSNSAPAAAATLLDAPSSFTVETTNSSALALAWTAGDVTANVQVFRDTVAVANLAAGTTSYAATGLSASTSYAFVVRHFKGAIFSSNSASVSNTTAALGPSAAPSGLSTSIPSDTEVTLSWTNGDSTADTEIFRNGSLVRTHSATLTSWTDSGRTAGTTYTYIIRHTKNSITSANTSGVTGRPTAYYTGGTVTSSGGYRIHTFTSNSTFSRTRPGTVEWLVVGGGGGGGCAGGSGGGGGGGGGGMRTGSSYVNASPSIVVGLGGVGRDINEPGGNGGTSSIDGYVSVTGGGGGGSGLSNGYATTDGSGGGGGWYAGDGDLGFGGAAGSYGYAGSNGAGGVNTAGDGYPCGGGGGAGAAGGAWSYFQSGAGGAGAASSISGASVTYAGGGGGAAGDNDDDPRLQPGAGGNGGGGAGGENDAVAGTDGLGGGGGGGRDSSAAGGSGIVIIRYLE